MYYVGVCSDLYRIFRLRGSTKCLGSDFCGLQQGVTMVTTRRSPEIWGIFQKIALKVLKIWKTTEKVSQQCKFLSKFFIFNARCGKNKNYIHKGYNRVSPKSYLEEVSMILSKNVEEIWRNYAIFQKFDRVFFGNSFKHTAKLKFYCFKGFGVETTEGSDVWRSFHKFSAHLSFFLKMWGIAPGSTCNFMTNELLGSGRNLSPQNACESFNF